MVCAFAAVVGTQPKQAAPGAHVDDRRGEVVVPFAEVRIRLMYGQAAMMQITAIVVGIVALAVPSTSAVASADDTPISKAAAACQESTTLSDTGTMSSDDPINLGGYDYEILDDGHSVIFEDASFLNAFDGYECLAEQIGLPEWTREVMSRTTSLAGLVTVELGEYTVMWSYHPDNGALVVLYDSEASGPE